MPRTAAGSRTRLLQAAEKLTYRRGFADAAIADIAREARVPPGNVYYYFKTKDEIWRAIIDLRSSRFEKRLKDWDRLDSPRDRLCAYVDLKIRNRDALARSGCPVGTLCSELRKRNDAVAKLSMVLFASALAWMEKQFRALGRGDESRSLAIHLLSTTQGATVLAHTFHDPEVVVTEAEHLKEWIRAL